MPSDSPTVRKNTLRTMTALCVQYGWKMYNCDVTAAFLQSEYMKREVYVKPPKDMAAEGTLEIVGPHVRISEGRSVLVLDHEQGSQGPRHEGGHFGLAAYYWNMHNKLKGLYIEYVDDGY